MARRLTTGRPLLVSAHLFDLSAIQGRASPSNSEASQEARLDDPAGAAHQLCNVLAAPRPASGRRAKARAGRTSPDTADCDEHPAPDHDFLQSSRPRWEPWTRLARRPGVRPYGDRPRARGGQKGMQHRSVSLLCRREVVQLVESPMVGPSSDLIPRLLDFRRRRSSRVPSRTQPVRERAASSAARVAIHSAPLHGDRWQSQQLAGKPPHPCRRLPRAWPFRLEFPHVGR